jgi:hypothetical protein
MEYTIALTNVGRGKANETKTISANGVYEAELIALKMVKRYLASKGVDLEPTGTDGNYNVSAGFHDVGQVTIAAVKNG